MPVVTATAKGLVEANGFRNIGTMAQSEGLDDVKNGYGYNYGVSDGTGFPGMFISVAPMSSYRIQIKIGSSANDFAFRSMGNGSWFAWKKVTFTNL